MDFPECANGKRLIIVQSLKSLRRNKAKNCCGFMMFDIQETIQRETYEDKHTVILN